MKTAKIVFGAKNKDKNKLETVIKTFSLAGADVFDVCADREIILFAKETIKNLNLSKQIAVCASITLDDDRHSEKAEILSERCTGCGQCAVVCPQKVIEIKENTAKVDTAGCVGCQKCLEICSKQAVIMYNENESFEKQFENAKIADHIEIHTTGKNKNLFEVFEFLKNNFEGEIGICISQNPYIKKKLEIIEKVKKIIAPKKLIVQADGNSISGHDNNISTTQKTIEECKNLQNVKDIIIIAAGGTNFQTAELARKNGVKIDGIAWGSFARKIIFEDENEEIKLNKARELINTIK